MKMKRTKGGEWVETNNQALFVSNTHFNVRGDAETHLALNPPLPSRNGTRAKTAPGSWPS
jgi:hypothetical protein